MTAFPALLLPSHPLRWQDVPSGSFSQVANYKMSRSLPESAPRTLALDERLKERAALEKLKTFTYKSRRERATYTPEQVVWQLGRHSDKGLSARAGSALAVQGSDEKDQVPACLSVRHQSQHWSVSQAEARAKGQGCPVIVVEPAFY